MRFDAPENAYTEFPAGGGGFAHAGEAIHAPGLQALVAEIAGWAHMALLREVALTPKPGLVDLRNSGAHRDMDYGTFVTSAGAIAPYFTAFCRTGASSARLPAALLLPLIRPIGIACEKAMFAATDNVNTHKGAIFSLGLFCSAAGRLAAREMADGEGNRNGLPKQQELCLEVAAICSGLVENDLTHAGTPKTVGEKLFRCYGMTGIRGEAASGYATVRKYALPVFHELTTSGHSEEIALLQCLLSLMAHNHDTNLFGRGGIEGMNFVRRRSREFLDKGGVLAPGGVERMAKFDDELIALNLSPGGSADLIAVLWFLSRFPR